MKFIIYYILKLYILYMKSFSNETLTFFFRPPTFWIFSKLHELCGSCRRNPPETLK